MFNNKLFSFGTMTAMHMTMVRLYEAARVLRGVEGQSAVARILNQSPQAVRNWEARGVSYVGMIEAERQIGCTAVWIECGKPPMAIGGDSSIDPGLSPPHRAISLTDESLAFAQTFDRAGDAKRQVIKQIVELPEHEMAAFVLIIRSIAEKYKKTS